MDKKDASKTASGHYEKIIPTAWLVAYRRTLSDIPFSNEIFERLDLLRRSHAFSAITEEMKAPNLAPQFEARYKLMNRLILEEDSKQVLEIASGYGPRGLELSRNKNIVYVELDLPEVIRDKREIINHIVKGVDINNLHLIAGNALDLDSLLEATTYFSTDKPLTITNEGLLRYLNFEEKSRVAKNIYHLLDIFGGVWITPDITFKNVMLTEEKTIKEQNERVRAITGIDTDQNRFENDEEAKAFFENLGFNVESHSYLEVRNLLVSPQRIHMDEKTLNKMIEFPVVYVMRIRK
jgi:O-methyltransferase involved in polyketide biosynthesis